MATVCPRCFSVDTGLVERNRANGMYVLRCRACERFFASDTLDEDEVLVTCHKCGADLTKPKSVILASTETGTWPAHMDPDEGAPVVDGDFTTEDTVSNDSAACTACGIEVWS